jgi:hypothetical protein
MQNGPANMTLMSRMLLTQQRLDHRASDLAELFEAAAVEIGHAEVLHLTSARKPVSARVFEGRH